MKRRRSRNRGFALLTVLFFLAVVSGAVAATLDESSENIRTAGVAKRTEMIRSGLEHGMHLGITHVRGLDAAMTVDPANDWDIFGTSGMARDFVGPLLYPPQGRDLGRYRVRVGLRPTQRGRPPAGEDVRTSYGQIVELQVSVEDNPPGPTATTEERVSVGVLIPRRVSHAQ